MGMTAAEPKIDYRVLLEKYIEHVVSCEGASFIDVLNQRYRSSVEFTPVEIAALKEIDLQWGTCKK